ncbi:hypothetical protein ACFYKT_11165 [Cytobacillus sp. FJAT-53684]|uniref:MFS transporter n=1 Tax=Cytobacillus mangrovibacter TaxID=3299024 RepID=A0ABW6K1V6_9BACI
MNIYLLAFASLILVVPLVYFLPLGLTKKGKLLIIAVSFLLALIGLSGNAIFDWWQSVLLIFSLVVLSSYLLDKKMKHLILIDQEEGTKSSFDTPAHLEDLPDNVHMLDGIGQIDFEDEKIEDIAGVGEEEQIKEEIDNDELFVIDEYEKIIESSVDPHANLEIEEEIIEPLFNKNNDVEVDDKIEEIESIVELGYMSELEKLILDSSEESLPSINESEVEEEQNKLISINLEKEANEHDDEFLEILSEFESVKQEAASTIELLVDIPVAEEKELEEFNKENPVNEEGYIEILSQLDNTEDELTDKPLESTLDVKDVYEEIVVEESLIIVSQEPSDIDSINTTEKGEKNDLQRQMFQTLIAQVELAKKMLDANQYEQLLKECMHPKMPYFEYYTFASLLIKHYHSINKYAELKELLKSLKAKYREYPILLQEVQFLLTYYDKKFDEK